MNTSLKWLGGASTRIARGPIEFTYLITQRTECSDLIPAVLKRESLRIWYATRGDLSFKSADVTLNDEPVTLDEAIELCEADAQELTGGEITAAPVLVPADTSMHLTRLGREQLAAALGFPADDKRVDEAFARCQLDEIDARHAEQRERDDFDSRVDNDFDGLS